jgi:arginyl-tRNA synthetase
MEAIRTLVQAAVQELFGVGVTPTISRPEPQFGDATTNVAMQITKQVGKAPRDIAQTLADHIQNDEAIAKVEVAGPGFLNITLTDSVLVSMLGASTEKSHKTVVIETNNPNPFKAMHIGHAYNAIIADTIANLIEHAGNRVYRVSYHGDVGLHVGRSMYALLHYIDGDISKLDQIEPAERNTFMSRMYAEGSRAYKESDDAKQAINELAKQSFTREDQTYAKVYDTIFAWSFEEIATNVARLGNKPVEKKFLESDADVRGVKIVRDNTPGVFEESDDALIFRGSDHGGFDNAFVGSNGLGLYAARDLGLIALKREQYHPQKSYIVTAEEQKDYFKGVLAAAALITPEESDVTTNISTGTVKLTSGKMSSRDGDVIEISWLFDQISEAIRARGGQVTDDVVAGALRYAFLRVRIGGDVVFDINDSVSIQGNSGPYLQYAHARAASILMKADQPISQSAPEQFDAVERVLLQKLTEYNDVVEKATNELLPHSICNYLYELAQAFNRFYEQAKVIGDERQTSRLWLVEQYRHTLSEGLGILGIVAPERL